ncbi:PDZ domain-containing protein [Pseudogemmobacter sp. W21_MBD1_M6]|uniref:PDZ domain-containing protein n=1 Tax=Pseudogemmobacter sp. W21_MBD1_M6 TaxID=3240271 RepID=UPI003F94E623
MGINTAIFGPSGGSAGIGFAIPIDMAMNVADQLVEFGTMRRGQIEVLVQDLTPALAKALGVPGRGGAVISDVIAGSPAQAAGLQLGDVIVAVDGIAVTSSANLRNRLGLLPAGMQVVLSLVRAGETLEIAVTLSGEDGPSGATPDAPDTGAALQGVTLRATDTGAGRDGQAIGVLVVSVAPNSASDLAGLREGDVIAAVNRSNVRTPEVVARIAGSSEGPVLLRVFPQGAALFLVIG